MSKKLFFLLAIVVYTVIALCGGLYYPGHWLNYIFFNLVSLFVFAMGFRLVGKAGLLFLIFFFFMGFWFKLQWHLLTGSSFLEPFGSFNFSPESWNEVLNIVSAALLGFLGSLGGLSLIQKRPRPSWQIGNLMAPPSGYQRSRYGLYVVLFLLIAGTAYLNVEWGIHQVGLAPRTRLPWPMNALIAFMLNAGFMLMLTVFLFWDFILKKNLLISFFIICVCAAVISISVMSRGMFFIQILPLLYAFGVYAQLKPKKILALMNLGLLFLFATVVGTSFLRGKLYPKVGINTTQRQALLSRLEVLDGGIERVKALILKGEPHQAHLQEIEAEKQDILRKLETNQVIEAPVSSVSKVEGQTSSTQPSVPVNAVQKDAAETSIIQQAGVNVVNLALTRFVGIEGVMAMQSYPSKSWESWWQAAFEVRNPLRPTLYQEVAKSSYRYSDNLVWQFATLPGIVAFLFYTGSLVFTFVGMFLVGLLVAAFEKGLLSISLNNCFLTCLIMSGLASTVAQFGVAPRQDFFYYGILLIFIAMGYGLIRLIRLREDRN